MISSLSRPRSSCAVRERRNPILPSEQPLILEKKSRGGETPTFFYSKYPQERPKGKTKTEFSKNSASTFSIASEELIDYRPSIRVNIQQTHIQYDRPQSIRVVGYSQSREPIIEEKVFKTRLQREPSPLLRYENDRKYCLPTEVGVKKPNKLFNSSRVFEDTNESYLFNGKIKNVKNKPTEISSVIGYEFALPYREQKVTAKL